MNAELLAIGTELTTGQTVNTNAAFLGRQLAAAGIRCARQTAVPDDWPAMIDAIRQSLARADVLLITGGLGPTADDRTVEAIAAASGCPLREAPDVARRIRAFYRLHGRRLNRLALRQARLPTGATALPNPIGTAPGIWLPLRRSILIAMPGVPREMRAMMERSVLPRLLRLPGRSPTTTRTLRTVGVIELQIQDVLKRIGTGTQEGLRLAIIEADKLADDALKRMGFAGEHMADRLDKISDDDLRSLDKLWRAHRIRNNVVHTPGFELSPASSRQVIEEYQAFFTEIGLLE